MDCTDEFDVQNMGKLLAGVYKARCAEFEKLKKMWPNPTPKQAKRIDEARKAYRQIYRTQRFFDNINRTN